VEGAVDEFTAVIDRRFGVDEPYAKRVESFFVRRDTENCAGVFDAVDDLKRSRSEG